MGRDAREKAQEPKALEPCHVCQPFEDGVRAVALAKGARVSGAPRLPVQHQKLFGFISFRQSPTW